uniref:Uncharacterized protein n=1 Tax=Eutreptiella gymnastica TaxID=73025 RepID=A0A7S1IF52_9EUGL|mmetsp:Transcript_152957/g.267289  ORF Transcript_152957/g.267289 Transcript_152957/m.267289 type:complete len:600 (+) Transcript_152957:112-1911(+)
MVQLEHIPASSAGKTALRTLICIDGELVDSQMFEDKYPEAHHRLVLLQAYARRWYVLRKVLPRYRVHALYNRAQRILAAVVCLQAAARGWLVRHGMRIVRWRLTVGLAELLQAHNTTFSDMWEQMQTRLGLITERHLDFYIQCLVQTPYWHWQANQRKAQWGAQTIQRLWRGWRSRQYAQYVLNRTIEFEQAEEAQLEERIEAAIDIQRVWRGGRARDCELQLLTASYQSRHTEAMAQVPMTRQQLRRDHVQRLQVEREATQTIRRICRGHSTRCVLLRQQKELRLLVAAQEEECWHIMARLRLDAAIIIQKLWRGFVSRSTWRYRWGRSRRYVDVAQIIVPQAIRIQCAWRCSIARCRRTSLTLERAATRIQAAYRGHQVRQLRRLKIRAWQWQELNRRMTFFQAHVRGWMVRRQDRHMLENAMHTQRRVQDSTPVRRWPNSADRGHNMTCSVSAVSHLDHTVPVGWTSTSVFHHSISYLIPAAVCNRNLFTAPGNKALEKNKVPLRRRTSYSPIQETYSPTEVRMNRTMPTRAHVSEYKHKSRPMTTSLVKASLPPLRNPPRSKSTPPFLYGNCMAVPSRYPLSKAAACFSADQIEI